MSIIEKTPRKVSKYKPPVVDDTPKLSHLFIISFQNGEQHRVKHPKSVIRPRNFVKEIMAEGSTDGNVYYPPSMVKKIKWEEV